MIKKFDKEINSIEAIKSLIVIMNERDRCSELRELEMKAHLWTVDKKLELLCPKHENVELSFDSLVVDVNEQVN